MRHLIFVGALLLPSTAPLLSEGLNEEKLSTQDFTEVYTFKNSVPRELLPTYMSQKKAGTQHECVPAFALWVGTPANTPNLFSLLRVCTKFRY